MKLLALILPLLVACTGHRQLCAYPTDTGWHVFATRAAFEARFPDTRRWRIEFSDLDMETARIDGRFDPWTLQSWVSCDDPEHPDADAFARMDHEVCHAVEFLYGIDRADPLWANLARNHPALMTHPEINARLKREHLWPSIFRGDF